MITRRPHHDRGPDRTLDRDRLVRPVTRDILRTETGGPLAIPPTRRELERIADEQSDFSKRAGAIQAWLGAEAARSVASYWVGAGVLEFCLERLEPSLEMILTEYAPATVARLRELFPAAQVERHDLRLDAPLEADVHLLQRVDSELTDAEWERLLRRFAAETLLVVPGRLAGVSDLVTDLVLRLRRRPLNRGSWVRSRVALERLWRKTHTARPYIFYDLEGWVLRPRRAR